MDTWREILAKGFLILAIFAGLALVFHGWPKIVVRRKEEREKEDQ